MKANNIHLAAFDLSIVFQLFLHRPSNSSSTMTLFQYASITFALTFLLLLLAGQTNGALTCKEDNNSDNQHQSAKLTAKTKPSKSGSNTIEMTSVQRSFKTFSPIVTRWKPSQAANVPTLAESTRQQKLLIPIGVSNYRPIEYVNTYNQSPFPHSYFDKIMASVANKSSSESAVNVNNTVAASSDINEVKVGDSQSEAEVMHPARAHPPRFIELESSYVPLTIRFPSRATKLNIIPGDNDLVGQDSNRHDSFGRRTSAGTGTATKSDSRSVDLDSRVIFGEEKRDEPLVLKQGTKTQVPDNMQRIIKCIFPDFLFDGKETVQSAC